MESYALLIAATLNAGTVLAIASLGLLINEKAGIINLGAEGMTVSYTHLDVYKRQCLYCAAWRQGNGRVQSQGGIECLSFSHDDWCGAALIGTPRAQGGAVHAAGQGLEPGTGRSVWGGFA